MGHGMTDDTKHLYGIMVVSLYMYKAAGYHEVYAQSVKSLKD